MDSGIEEPGWLTAKADQRIALMEEAMGSAVHLLKLNTSYMMTFLTEPDEGSTPVQMARWEQTCDNCGRYRPGEISTGHLLREQWGLKLAITFGVCPECRKTFEVDS